MARMFPEAGPHANCNSEAEIKLYHEFARTLSDDWIIYHGIKFYPPQPSPEDDPPRECDFLIVTPTGKLLALEVKGGQEKRAEKQKQRWYANMKRNTNNRKVNPFKQVETVAHMVSRALYDGPLTHPFAPTIPVIHAVWFTDVVWTSTWATDAMNLVVLDREDFTDVRQGLLRVANNQANGHAMAPFVPECIDALTATFAPTMRVTARFSSTVGGPERQIEELTREQFLLLEELDAASRLCVMGAAGTGKTVLAYEKARRLAARGLRVLLMCENPALATSLMRQLQPDEIGIKTRLHVRSVENVTRAVREAAQQNPPKTRGGSPQHVADLLAQALRQQKRVADEVTYDAVLVDDAQDITTALWRSLPRLLRDQRRGMIYAFGDPIQREESGAWRPPMPLARDGLLTNNLRNTRAVFEIVSAFHQRAGARPDQFARCTIEGGRPTWFLDPAGMTHIAPGQDSERAALEVALDRLIKLDGFDPNDILIITCRSQVRSRFFAKNASRRVGSHIVVKTAHAVRRSNVSLSTIRSARGLERRIVILAELDGIEGHRLRDRYLYQAASRAVHQLVVLGSEPTFYARRG
jgi:hypothetical protein